MFALHTLHKIHLDSVYPDRVDSACHHTCFLCSVATYLVPKTLYYWEI